MLFREVYDKNKNELESVCRGLFGPRLDKFLEYLSNTDFYYAPAAKAHHDNYPGGLYDHSKSLFIELLNLNSKMNKEWSQLDLFIIAFSHDLCKVGLYESTLDSDNNVIYSYDINHTSNHGTESLRIVADIIPEFINERVATSIVFHMGLWTNDIPGHYDQLLESQTKDDLVFFTHVADMISSRSSKRVKSVKFIDDHLIIENE